MGHGSTVRSSAIDSENPTGYTQIAEESVSGAALKSYVYGPQRVSMKDGSGIHYCGYDAHSGVRLLLNSSGNVTDTWEYDAFGNLIGRHRVRTTPSPTAASRWTWRLGSSTCGRAGWTPRRCCARQLMLA